MKKQIEFFSWNGNKDWKYCSRYLSRPEVVILDEPFNGLDVEGHD